MKLKIIIVLIQLLILFEDCQARNVHRPVDPLLAKLTVHYVAQDQICTLDNSHLQEHALFHLFDEEHFYSHQLPTGPIFYRYHSSNSVDPAILRQLIQELLGEIASGKRGYTHFTVLKNRDFRKKMQTGALILKFKEYPFVLKLFIESPESFVQPFSKGFEPAVFFLMGGGINRHLNGFTRLKNLEFLREQVACHPDWAQRVDFPRKWFWMPDDPSWLELVGYNIGGPYKTQRIQIPAIYGVICDEIQIERSFSLGNPEDRETILELSNYLGQHIDPHITNYVYEKGTGKIVPIDSEHFLTMVGMEKSNQSASYPEWYCTLSLKMLRDTFGRTKGERREYQFKTHLAFGE